MIGARNESPFNPKHHISPNCVSAMPPITGPITRATLNWIDFSAIAFGMSSFSPAWESAPGRPGRRRPAPARNERKAEDLPDRARGGRRSAAVSRKAQPICTHCEISSTLRRSMRSATTPPTSENRKIGMPPRKASSPSRNGELESLRTSQLCASDLHPRADAGGAGADPHQAEIAVLKCFEDPADHGWRLFGNSAACPRAWLGL